MPITELLEKNAKLYSDEVCLVEINPELAQKREWKEFDLVEPDTRAPQFRFEITWKEFDNRANRFANTLIKSGVKKGDKVAILLMNCLEWLPIYFGILKTGALAVPLNFRFTGDEIKYCLNLSEADLLIFGPEFTERVEPIYKDLPRIKSFIFLDDDYKNASNLELISMVTPDMLESSAPDFASDYAEMVAKASADAPGVKLTDDDDAAIYFSSGTTGFPKAILHDHTNLMASCATEQNHHGQTRTDNFLCIPPLYHTGAKMHWFGSLLAGSKAVLLKGVKPEWIIKVLSDEKITIVWLLVPWAQDILDAFDSGRINLAEYDLSNLRLMHIGAQPVPPSLVKRWKTYFPHHLYDTNYGLSESIGPGCVHLGVENIHKVGAIGVPGYGWQCQILDENKNPLPKGEVGELSVCGKGVMKCYFNDPEATAASLKDGWLYTGDMARMDEDGFIWLVDRKKDVIITGGENIYPVQIEDFLRAHPSIKDVAVIGLPDHRLGEITGAIISVKEGTTLTEDEVNEFCKALPRYKRPRKIIFAEVPRNPTGKIEKPKLRERYAAAHLIEQQMQG